MLIRLPFFLFLLCSFSPSFYSFFAFRFSFFLPPPHNSPRTNRSHNLPAIRFAFASTPYFAK
jgi:hypothetical protein